MTATSSATQARQALKALLVAEFAPEGFPVLDDRLHGSQGLNGTKIATSPVRQQPWSRDSLVLVTNILVQFYGEWEDNIDPAMVVDPTEIEGYAERFERALRGKDPQTDHTWFFSLVDLTFPPDPTDNITRFEATVAAWGNNPTVMETTG